MNINDTYNNKNEEEIEIIADEFVTEHDLKVLNECWHISIRLKNRSGNSFPQSQIQSLNTVGRIENIKVITDGIPPFNEFNPELCYIGFEIVFKCDESKNKIESFFNSIRDDYRIRILPPNGNISDYIELINDLPEENRRIGEILKEIGSLTDLELEEVLNIQKELSDGIKGKDTEVRKPLGELLVEEKMIQEPVLKAALDKQEKLRSKYNVKK